MVSPTAVLCLTPSLTTWAPFAQWFCPCGQYYPRDQKNITRLLLSRLQGNKPHRNSASGTCTNTCRNSSEPSEPCRRNLHQHAPELSRTLRNLPRPSGTNLLEPSGTYLRNLRQHTPEPSGTYIVLHRNSPEPSGTRLRNIHLHQHTPELSGTFQNLPPEPAPATRTGTHRSLSGLKTPLAYAVGEKGMRLANKQHWSLRGLGLLGATNDEVIA